MNNPENTDGVSFEMVAGEEICVIHSNHPEAAREAADQNFPAGARRIEQLTMLLSTGLLLNDHGTDEDVEAAERTAEAIVDALIHGAAPQLVAFLKDGQSAEIADEVYGWLVLATGVVAGQLAREEGAAKS